MLRFLSGRSDVRKRRRRFLKVTTLFAAGGEIAADVDENVGALEGAKAVLGFLL